MLIVLLGQRLPNQYNILVNKQSLKINSMQYLIQSLSVLFVQYKQDMFYFTPSGYVLFYILKLIRKGIVVSF
uniref:Uncharacterized protein n=1 Tax=Arundo donax TaxID=35708 RepID=A0A0A9DCY8_ARUDO